MLTVINLFVIDKIFTEVATNRLTPSAKSLYLNCLTHHFRDKKPTVVNAVGFEFFKNDIPNYAKHQRVFEELHKAELVSIREDAVAFLNVWGNYIDRRLLEKVAPDTYVAGFSFQGTLAFIEEMRGNTGLHELCCMKHRLARQQVLQLLELFHKEQSSIDKRYTGYSDCAKHFINWIPNNVDKVPKEVVKSNSKLLGE